MAGIPDEDFEIYQHVINATYRAHDMMLQALLAKAGPDTTVILVSDHGFHSDHLRPKFTPPRPRRHHRLAPQSRRHPRQRTRHQARFRSLWCAIVRHRPHHPPRLRPPHRRRHGRPRPHRTLRPRTDRPIHPHLGRPRWQKASRGSLSEEDSQALLEQFVALGYIDEVSDDPTEAADETHRENKWNLARAYLYTGKHDGALPLLEDCFNAYPERTDYAQALAKTQLALGLTTESEETLAICLETFGQSVSAHVIQAQIEIEKGNHKKALEHLDTIRQQAGEEVPVLELSCRAYATLGQWQEARSTAEKLLSIDPTNVQAHNTLTRCHLDDNDPQAAADSALAAISFQFASPRAHLLLGQALIQLERWTEAEHALVNCLQLDRDNTGAIVGLKQIYIATDQQDRTKILEDELFRRKVITNAERSKHLQSLRDGIAARAKERHAERQQKREAAAKKAAAEAAIQPCQFTIVSGLPRSGTSLMMQMLRAAGMELMHDDKRVADEDNLEGYWEWEDIKSLKKNPRLIEQADGKVIKVISALLPQLPPRHKYRIIFMHRPVAEVVDSQWKMLERSGQAPRSEKQHLIETQETHVAQTLAQLRQRQDVDLIEIDYPKMVANPQSQLPALIDFLGETTPHPEKLTTAIRKDLHRNKTPQPAST